MKLLFRLAELTKSVSQGQYDRIDDIFQLSVNTDSSLVAEMAEAFGMMFVMIEARELRLHETIEALKEANTVLGVTKEQLTEAFEELKLASYETISRLAKAAENKDEDARAHIQRISHYSVALAKGMNMDQEFTDNLYYAASMHDVGKIGIPDKILLKPDKLTDDEWDVMKRHAELGAQILEGSSSKIIRMAEIIARTHHEKWDGSGYPLGLKGKAIPLAGRIVAVADVFDALTSKRPYKRAMPEDEAFQIIRSCRGAHFDPDIVDVFFQIKEKILTIKSIFSI